MICIFAAGTTQAAGVPCAAGYPDSIASLQQVKKRTITYLLGGSGEGPYRQQAVRENDEWVKMVLAQAPKPLVWEERTALTMNVKLNAFATELRQLAIAFCSAGSRYEKSPELKKRIAVGMENVLKYFNPASPRPGNWYQWLISLPDNLGATGLLMEPFLPPELLSRLRTTLRHQLGNKLVLTGTNAAWESRNHIYLALLDSDPGRLQRAADYVFRTVRYGTEQGVREDYCYLFHGRLPYAGGYGSGFAQTIAEFIYVFEGTPFAISPVHLDLVVNLLLEHTRWFMADGQIDLHIRGRTFMNSGNWGSVLEALLVLAQTDDPRSSEVAATAAAMLSAHPNADLDITSAGFADRIKTAEGELPGGFRYWPSGEIGVFKQSSFHIGFRQYSSRVQDYEYLNREDGGEGEEGWNLAYGFTNILREDGMGSWYSTSEHGAMFPDIDLEHLPGTTSRIGGNPVNPRFRPDPRKPTKSTTGFSLNFGKSAFAGAAGWENGGVAGFILEPAYGNFIAKKSLHFFPQGFWALGSGISSKARSSETRGKPVHTTLLQWVCSKRDPVLSLPAGALALDRDSVTALENVPWFWIKNEHVAVVFNEPSDIFVRLKGKIITAWLDHGKQPSSARYAYAVLPDVSLEEARRFASELPFRPVQNDENVHAVRGETDQHEGIVFFEPDSCLGIKSQSPVIVYHKGDREGGIYTIQDPLHRKGKIRLAAKALAGKISLPDPEVNVTQAVAEPASIEVSSILGRIYRFGYGTDGQKAYSEPRKDLDLSSYHDFKVDAISDAEKTILTVQLPDDAVRDGYRLSVHFSKSQRLHDFTEADVIDRPSPNTIRYRWNRTGATGPGVFSDYWNVKHGQFKVYLITQLTETIESFSVPVFNPE